MAALVAFPIMATSLGTIPNRCLSVTKRQPPGHEAPRPPAATPRTPGTASLHSPLDLTPYIDDLTPYIDALPPPHAADCAMRYCCDRMRDAAENVCEQHPERFDCPDCLV